MVDDISSLVAVGNRIKMGRVASNSLPKPIPVDRFSLLKNVYVCRDHVGNQHRLYLSKHCIDSFIIRYPYIDRSFYVRGEEWLWKKIREMFNSCRYKVDDCLRKKNLCYGIGEYDIIFIGNSDYEFTVNLLSRTIMTFSLCGEYRKYNDDHKRMI